MSLPQQVEVCLHNTITNQLTKLTPSLLVGPCVAGKHLVLLFLFLFLYDVDLNSCVCSTKFFYFILLSNFLSKKSKRLEGPCFIGNEFETLFHSFVFDHHVFFVRHTF